MIQELSSLFTQNPIITESSIRNSSNWDEIKTAILAEVEHPEHYEVIFTYFTGELIENITTNLHNVLEHLQERLDDEAFKDEIKVKIAAIAQKHSISIDNFDDLDLIEFLVNVEKNEALELLDDLFCSPHKEGIKHFYSITKDCVNELHEKFGLSFHQGLEKIQGLFVILIMTGLRM